MITVEPLAAETWSDVLDVDVTEEHRALLDFPSMVAFLAESRLHLDFTPHAIRADGVAVGFVSHGVPAEERTRW